MKFLLTSVGRVVAAAVLLFTSVFGFGASPDCAKMPDVKPGEYGQWVDPFIGTGGLPWTCAMLSPGATSPFGTVRLSPDTTFPLGLNLFNGNTSGYYYGHRAIWGFSHTRLSGTGACDMGHFRVTPSVGKKSPSRRLTSPIYFSHSAETATPGYYAVRLPGIGCLAELTSSGHVGVHRYTFSSKRDAHLFIDSTSFLNGGSASDGAITVFPEDSRLEGEGTVYTSFTGRYGGLKAYFAAEFDTPLKSFSTWLDGESVEGRAHAEGDDTGADLCFGSLKGKAVELKLAISFVSIENARENLEAETGGLDFEGVRDAAREVWDSWLSKIKLEASDSQTKTIFYTALYHTMIMPTDFTDVNGQYLGFAGTVSTAEDFTYRTDMSLWDTCRTEHSLLTLIAPEIQRDCLKSLVEMAKAGGTLPRWPSGGGYTGSMFGSPADIVITESYLKGLTDFDVEAAYSFMKKTSDLAEPVGADGRKCAEEYNQYGYCPAEMTNNAVSRTLEYAWADGCIAALACALGKADEAEHYAAKSMNYQNLFDDETKYFRPKNSDGSWHTPFNPNVTSYYDAILPGDYADDYCEGSARQWRWSVLQDTEGLIELFGSEEYFVSELEDFMSDASSRRAAIDPGSGYWQGNQPDIHAPYLFNEAGRPDLTQKWVRWVLEERHSTDVNGLDGNDDGGTLSAWYVLSAMGFYPVAGSSRYWLGSPCVEKAEIALEGGKLLTVVAENLSDENIYVDSVTFNGKELTSTSFDHSLIADGGTLAFVMSSSPN